MKLFRKTKLDTPIADIKAIRQRICDILASDGDLIAKGIALDALEQEFKSDRVIKALIFELLSHPLTVQSAQADTD